VKATSTRRSGSGASDRRRARGRGDGRRGGLAERGAVRTGLARPGGGAHRDAAAQVAGVETGLGGVQRPGEADRPAASIKRE
jgi:hypothetical protein